MLVWFAAFFSLLFAFVIILAVVFRFLKKGNKYHSLQTKNLLSHKLPFVLDELINDLGGINNIIEASCRLSKIDVVLKNYEIINYQNLKRKGASGIIVSLQKVTIIFGTISQVIAQKITARIQAKS